MKKTNITSCVDVLSEEHTYMSHWLSCAICFVYYYTIIEAGPKKCTPIFFYSDGWLGDQHPLSAQ